jgi:hypothetical protein
MVQAGLIQLLVVLVGAAIVAAAVRGFSAEWHALFKKPMSNALARTCIYLLSICLQAVNWHAHGLPTLEFAVLAILTAFCATGIYRLAEKH